MLQKPSKFTIHSPPTYNAPTNRALYFEGPYPCSSLLTSVTMAMEAHAHRPLNGMMKALMKTANGGKGRREWGGVRRAKEEGSNEVSNGRDFIILKCFIDSWNLQRRRKRRRKTSTAAVITKPDRLQPLKSSKSHCLTVSTPLYPHLFSNCFSLP